MSFTPGRHHSPGSVAALALLAFLLLYVAVPYLFYTPLLWVLTDSPTDPAAAVLRALGRPIHSLATRSKSYGRFLVWEHRLFSRAKLLPAAYRAD